MAEALPRRRTRDADLTPEQRAALEEVRQRHRTPEARAEAARVREAVQQEFPPLTANDALLTMLATLRTERERQGLSLADVAACTGMDRSMISRLELGKIPNPTYQTLCAYIGALAPDMVIGLIKPASPWKVKVCRDGYGVPYIMVSAEEAESLHEYLAFSDVACLPPVDGATVGADVCKVIALDRAVDVKRVRILIERWKIVTLAHHAAVVQDER